MFIFESLIFATAICDTTLPSIIVPPCDKLTVRGLHFESLTTLLRRSSPSFTLFPSPRTILPIFSYTYIPFQKLRHRLRPVPSSVYQIDQSFEHDWEKHKSKVGLGSLHTQTLVRSRAFIQFVLNYQSNQQAKHT